jgi:hypothetical protein
MNAFGILKMNFCLRYEKWLNLLSVPIVVGALSYKSKCLSRSSCMILKGSLFILVDLIAKIIIMPTNNLNQVNVRHKC